MTDMNILSAAELARKKLFDLRESLRLAAGTPPKVVDLLPALPSDNVEKLQLARQGHDCDVELFDVQVPPGAQPGDIGITLMKGETEVSGWVELPITIPDPFIMVLKAIDTVAEGPFSLRYKTQYASNTVTSDASLFFIDKTAPNHGSPGPVATPPAEVVNGLVTREILDKLDGLTMTVETPSDMKEGDRYYGYYGKSIPGVLTGVFSVTDDLTRPIEIKIPKSQIETGSSGDFIFYSKYEDRVGNLGPESAPLDLYVRLTPVPSGLQPPEVPEYDDGVIDLDDAWPHVGVVIPTFANGLPGDQVKVTFDGIVQPLKLTDGTTQVIVDVPFADVASNGDGPREVLVTYVIVRGSDEYPELTGIRLNIDLTIPGPTNPEPDPDLGNPNLIKLVVKGSTADDTLVEGDIGSLIDIDLTIYEKFKAGDLVNLYWNDELVPPPEGHYAVVGTEDPDFKIPFKLPSAVFEATGNGIQKARYIITNPTQNGENKNPSPPTDVDVYIHPVSLPDPEILHLYTSPIDKKYLDCSSLRDIPVVGKAAIVKVQGGGSLAADMKLDFVWSGGRYPGPTPVPEYLFDKTLTGNEHVDGFEVYLPFNAALRPIVDGVGGIVYTTTVDGRTHSSVKVEVRVVVIDSNEDFCPGTRAE
ncbi:hypothetical protein D3C84_299270 [compost metagenome]